MQCYTDALATAYGGWKTRAIARELVHAERPASAATALAVSSQLARICYHVPFCKMAKKAHAALRACDGVESDDPASYRAQVEPSLWACSRVGNIYTGSLYLALLGVLDTDAVVLATKRIGLFSYGSGCTSEFFSGVVGQRAAEMTAKAKLGEVLADRERITIDEYERIMTLVTPLENQHGAFRFTGVDDHRRQYTR
jgi:hydroxymethylglutaryl-CoA synthase